jgi:hypothetical protein
MVRSREARGEDRSVHHACPLRRNREIVAPTLRLAVTVAESPTGIFAAPCSHGDTVTVSLPAPPAGGYQANSTKNPLKLPYVLWVTSSVPTTCAAPPTVASLAQVSLNSTQPTRFYIAACARPKSNQQSTGDSMARLNAALQF